MDRYAEYMPFARLDNPAWTKLPLLTVIDLFVAYGAYNLPPSFAPRPDLYAFTYRDTTLYVGVGNHGGPSLAAWRRLCHHIAGYSAVGRCIHGSWPRSTAFEVYVGHTPDLFPVTVCDPVARALRLRFPYLGCTIGEGALIRALRPVFNLQCNPDPRPLPAGLALAVASDVGARKIRELRNSLLTNGAVSTRIEAQTNQMAAAVLQTPRGLDTGKGLR